MKFKMKIVTAFLGLLLASSSVFAADSSCGTGKCGGDMKKEMKACEMKTCDMKNKKEHKCNCESKEKCTCDMKKEMKGSCGTGKCGGAMKNDMSKMDNEMKDEMKEKKGSCGTGKCGSK